MRRENSTEPSLIPEDLASHELRLEQATRPPKGLPQDLAGATPESRNVLWLEDHAEAPERWDGLA